MTEPGDGGYILREATEIDRDFVLLKNAWVRDRKLSFRARGIYAYLRSLPPKTKMSVKQLTAVVDGVQLPGKKLKTGESRDAITAAINELEAVGYLHRTTSQHYGRFSVQWLLTDPANMLVGLFEEAENTVTEIPARVDNSPVDNSATVTEIPARTVTEIPETIKNTKNTLKRVNDLTIEGDLDSVENSPAAFKHQLGCSHFFQLNEPRLCVVECEDNQAHFAIAYPGEAYPSREYRKLVELERKLSNA